MEMTLRYRNPTAQKDFDLSWLSDTLQQTFLFWTFSYISPIWKAMFLPHLREERLLIVHNFEKS